MAILNGTLCILKVSAGAGSTPAQLDLQTEGTLTITQEEIEITNKESGGFGTFIGGKRGGSIAFSGFFDPDEATNSTLSALVDSFDLSASGFTDRLVEFTFGTAAAGDGFLVTGEGILASIDVSANTEETVTVSGTITMSGSYTMAFS